MISGHDMSDEGGENDHLFRKEIVDIKSIARQRHLRPAAVRAIVSGGDVAQSIVDKGWISWVDSLRNILRPETCLECDMSEESEMLDAGALRFVLPCTRQRSCFATPPSQHDGQHGKIDKGRFVHGTP